VVVGVIVSVGKGDAVTCAITGVDAARVAKSIPIRKVGVAESGAKGGTLGTAGSTRHCAIKGTKIMNINNIRRINQGPKYSAECGGIPTPGDYIYPPPILLYFHQNSFCGLPNTQNP
jgi:hypothetical protein